MSTEQELKQLHTLRISQEAALSVTNKLIAAKEKTAKKVPSDLDMRIAVHLEKQNARRFKTRGI